MSETFVGHPDFSGEWTFSPGLSNLQMTVPDAVSFIIDHREPAFRLERTLRFGDRKDTFALELVVGEESSPFVRGTSMLYPSLGWDANDLVFETRIAGSHGDAMNTVRYHLENDGELLIADETYRGGDKQYDNRWVFRRSD